MTQAGIILGWLVLAIGVPLNLYVVLLLRRRARARRDLGVLGERYLTALCLGVGVLVFGLIFVNNDQLVPPLSVEVTKIITRSIFFVLAVVPAVAWLWLHRSTRKP